MAAGDGGFDHHEIARLLPHRYPFQFVDRVVEFVDGQRIVALKNLSLLDPFFRGHFPDNPVMPGVLICEALAQAGALLAHRSTDGVPPEAGVVLSGLDNVRFRRPVVPGDQLRLEVTITRRHRPLWRLHGRATVDGQLVAEADILAMEVSRSRRA
ncbi:MAG: 3-hydroxyacyl-ACP dehydratase FabZ [Deltaproteobacteria bacterium]|nr:3-hydroxyacyl-ACP dehydratase FabZ [Deltaproteobacteria bacterium]MBI3387299.1 3-hydroxyacyl-ACP dehydratase FabZ [Deltaproteobacteria bacterium]